MKQPTFPRSFANPVACYAFLKKARIEAGVVCCQGQPLVWSGAKDWRCKGCGRRGSVTTATIFDGSANLSLWFKAVWLVSATKYGCSARELERRLGLSYSTAYAWRAKIRALMGHEEPLETDSGFGGEIELEVIQLPAGKNADKPPQIVLIALQKTSLKHWKVRLASPRDARPASVIDAVETIIKPGSSIETTQWEGFRDLSGGGYKHRSQVPISGIGDTMTDVGEGIRKELDRLVTEFFRQSIRDLTPYLREHAFRHNQKQAGQKDLFTTLLHLACTPSVSTRN